MRDAMTHALDVLFPDGQPLVYETTAAGKHVGHQWTLPPVAVDDGCDLTFLVETDPGAIGLGGEVIRQRGVLRVSSDWRPVRYAVETNSASFAAVFDDATVRATLADGTELAVARDGADFVLQTEMIGQLAIRLCMARTAGPWPPAPFRLFLINQLLTIVYSLEASAGEPGTFVSSFQEVLHVDDDGVLSLIQVSSSGARVERKRGVALPGWAGGRIAPAARLVYSPGPAEQHRSEEVLIPSAAGALGATLTFPAQGAPRAAVLFIAGSGPVDRHGIAGQVDTGAHEIVDAFAHAGIAGLRFDKPGTGSTPSGSQVLERGFNVRVSEARTSLEFLREKLPAHTPIVLAGHSEGGLVALVMAARESNAIDGLILLACPGRPLDQIIEEQLAWRADSLGLPEAARLQQLKEFQEYVHWVRQPGDWDPAVVPPLVYAGLRTRTYFQEVLPIDPAGEIGVVPCPVFIAQGASDVQISIADARRLFESGQRANVDATLEIYPGLDHLFKLSSGPRADLQDYYDASRRVADGVIRDLVGWIHQIASPTERGGA